MKHNSWEHEEDKQFLRLLQTLVQKAESWMLCDIVC